MPQRPAAVLAGQHVHAAVFEGGIVDGDPDGAEQLEREVVEVGVILVPGLF